MSLLHAVKRQFQSLREMALDLARIDHICKLFQNAMVRFYIHLMVWLGSKQTPDERQRLRHELGSIHLGLALDDRADLAERRANPSTRVHVLVCRVCNKDIPWLLLAINFDSHRHVLLQRYFEVELLDLTGDILSVIDDVSRTHVFRKLDCLRS